MCASWRLKCWGKFWEKSFWELFSLFHYDVSSFLSKNNSFSVIQFSFSSAFPLWIVVDAFSLPASKRFFLDVGRNFISALAAENQRIRLPNETKRNLKGLEFRRNWISLEMNELNSMRQAGGFEGENKTEKTRAGDKMESEIIFDTLKLAFVFLIIRRSFK